MPSLRLAAVLLIGFVLRVGLCAYHPFAAYAGTRLELSTPVTSWKALQEGIYLYDQGLDPYEGTIFRQAPLLLMLFRAIPEYFVPATFALADLGTALALVGVAYIKNKDRKEAPLDPWWIALIVLMNPLSVLSTAARSTTCLSNLCLALALLGAASGSVVSAACAFSFSMHLSMPIILLPALVVLLNRAQKESMSTTIKQVLPVLLVHQGSLLFASRIYTDSWTFLRTYAAPLVVQDLTPNIGLYWYFFIEMFDHFRNFFLLVFQAHLACYALPITLKLRFNPLLAFTVLAGIFSTFKAYPSVGDTAFYHSLLALHPELAPHMRHPLFTIMAHLYTLLLLPIFHYLWLYAGSGNSNFYYASTLVWALANGLGVMDTLSAGVKRRFLWELKQEGHEALQEDWETPNKEDWTLVNQ
ncbi:PIG-U-domain-containing protein [Cystobasidium minutum MCA 4210]|uniref:PIG-U-domain-containing protein n=1 Tax=Cystobasidium minutum MCA 4210 TaxID=1397322 RepID=UPI0034CD6F6E|eukprot:jgi/Rhomi1/192035/gm1.249_g